MNGRIKNKTIATSTPHKTQSIADRKQSDACCKTDKLNILYKYILNGGKRRKAKPREPKTIGGYDPRLRGPSQNGFGGHQTQKIKDLKGNTYGPAGPCKTLSAEERAEVEADLKAKGLL